MASSRLSAAPVTKATRAGPGREAEGPPQAENRVEHRADGAGQRPPASSARGFAGVRPRPRNRARSVSNSIGPVPPPRRGPPRPASGPRPAAGGGTAMPRPLDEFRLQEQLGKCRVGLVGPAMVQADLGVAGQVEVARPVAVVDNRDQPDFGVVRPAGRRSPAASRCRHPAAGNRPGRRRKRPRTRRPARHSG